MIPTVAQRLLLVLVFVLLTLLPASPSAAAQVPEMEASTDQAESVPHLSTLAFIENKGQFPDAARFRAGNLWLAEDSLWLTVIEPEVAQETSPFEGQRSESASASATSPRQGINLKLSFVGANPHPRIEPFGRQETYINYFRGNDPTQWRSHVPTWAGVRYRDIYPGLDLEVSSVGGQWTWRLVSSGEIQVASQSFAAVQLRVEGGEHLTLVDNQLEVTTSLGEVKLPLILVDDTQISSNVSQISIASSNSVHQPFTAIHASSISRVAETSALRWATFLGGSDYDYIQALALTADDEVMVAGEAQSVDFPVTPGAYDTVLDDGLEGFIARLSADGTTLRWATFLSSISTNSIHALEVVSSDEIVVVGETYSADFPVTPGAYDTEFDDIEGFVARLSADGTTLRWATFLGGSSYESVYAVESTNGEEIIVAGSTNSPDFPVTPSAYDTEIDGSPGFVARLSADGTTLRWATFFGDSSFSDALELTANEEIVVVGQVALVDFPVTPGAYDTKYAGESEGYIARLSADGTTLRWATFLGGSNVEFIYTSSYISL